MNWFLERVDISLWYLIILGFVASSLGGYTAYRLFQRGLYVRLDMLETHVRLLLHRLPTQSHPTEPIRPRFDSPQAGPQPTNVATEPEWPVAEPNPEIPPARLQTSSRAVELQDGAVVPSTSLAPVASLIVSPFDSIAELVLNPDVELDPYAIARWRTAFSLKAEVPYRRYRTTRSAKVHWNGQAEKGRVIDPGTAEPM